MHVIVIINTVRTLEKKMIYKSWQIFKMDAQILETATTLRDIIF